MNITTSHSPVWISRRASWNAITPDAQAATWVISGPVRPCCMVICAPLVLKPVAVFPDGARTNGVLVMCEVMMPDGKTPHPSNKRATILDDEGAWFGFEQEYFLYKNGRPLGFPCGADNFPYPQGEYYTGVGYKNVGCTARAITEEHIDGHALEIANIQAVVDDMVASNQILYEADEHPDHVVVIKYVPYVGDSKRAMDEYTSEMLMGGKYNPLNPDFVGWKASREFNQHSIEEASKLALFHWSLRKGDTPEQAALLVKK